MNIRYITCSDPRETNSVKSVLELAMLNRCEIAVQCHPSKMSAGMPRYVWFQELLSQAYNIKNIHLAIHINQDWCNAVCNGKIPTELLPWLQIKNTSNRPIIQRIQLNMPQSTAQNLNPDILAKVIHDFSQHEFIIQYNNKTKDAVAKLHDTGAKFSLLFDASGGNGKSPTKWEKPVYENHPMGYSGGLSPENVYGALNQISALVPEDKAIWTDAEGRLKSSELFEEKPKFDTELAGAYVKRVQAWIAQYGTKTK